MKIRYAPGLVIIILLFGSGSVAQISPGELSSVHAHLAGISNCTQCHTIGEKVADEKCLTCHQELKSRIRAKRGYHASAEVSGKSCVGCHSDHHGANFRIVRLDPQKFNHSLTGFPLTGGHRAKDCRSCHKPANIGSPEIRRKRFTYLGLNPECVGCHADNHRSSLGTACSECHLPGSFRPASNFNHDRAAFRLEGGHKTVECIKCHKVSLIEGKRFQEFKGIPFRNCSDCHADPHEARFGKNCEPCHAVESFLSLKPSRAFDHSQTGFRLVDRHQTVPCRSCHKINFTNPVRHIGCTDCHKDAHAGQFTKQGVIQDCSVCHSNKGFADSSSYTLEQHNEGKFVLSGAHAKAPCFSCHKKQGQWTFRDIGTTCTDCHKNIHENQIGYKYYSGPGCKGCHNEEQWSRIRFDHSVTNFALSAPHEKQPCRACHFRKNSWGQVHQEFAGLSPSCEACHQDIHRGQFVKDGSTDCLRCHTKDSFRIPGFDHNTTAYKLDARHVRVVCTKCHKPVTSEGMTYTRYRIAETKCEDCHSFRLFGETPR